MPMRIVFSLVGGGGNRNEQIHTGCMEISKEPRQQLQQLECVSNDFNL